MRLATPPRSPTRPPILQTPLTPFEFVPAFYTEMKCGTLRRVNLHLLGKKVPIPKLLTGNQTWGICIVHRLQAIKVTELPIHLEDHFAGGTAVHISSGTAALTISIYLEERRGYGTEALACNLTISPMSLLALSSSGSVGSVSYFRYRCWFFGLNNCPMLGFDGSSALVANTQSSMVGFDGITVIPGGWLDRHWVQLAIQLANSSTGIVYSFVVTVSFHLSNFGAILTQFRLGHALYPRPADEGV